MNAPKQPRWGSGDEFTYKQANQHSEGIERADNLHVDADSGLKILGSTTGKTIRRQGNLEPFIALLSAATSPYSWTKYRETAAGTLTSTGITGTTNAYEANGRASLGGKYVRLYPDGQGAYRFEVMSCCSCGGTLTVNVKCGSVNISGATVEISQGATTLTGTTNASGNATFSPTASGTWDIEVTATNYATYTSTFTYSCSNQTVNVVLTGTANVLSGNVDGCNSANLEGATVTLTQGATTLGTGTTDASGNYSITFNWSSGLVTITATRSRFATYTDTFTPTGCNATTTRNFTMSPATGSGSGYRCLGCGGALPISETLTNTPPFGGPFTMNFGTATWLGYNYINARVYDNNTGCAFNIKTTADFEMRWELSGTTPTACELIASYKGCPAAARNPVQYPEPGSYGYVPFGGAAFASSVTYVNSPFSYSYTISYVDADGTTVSGTGTITE